MPHVLTGDSPFHAARVRKLVELGSLTPWRLDELAGGGLHPGYAFPLWHAFLAAVAKLSGVDTSLVMRYESALLAPLAVLVAYEAGIAAFRVRSLGAAAAAAQVALFGLAAGHGGTYTILTRPSPSARQLVVPAVLALVFAYMREPLRSTLLTIGVAALALALVHPTYAAFVCIPLVGWIVVRSFVAPLDARRIAHVLVAVAVPTGLVSLALLPLKHELLSGHSTPAHYREQLVFHGSSYHLAPEVFGRNGAVAVAGLALVPLAALAWRRRWSSFVLGGSLAVLAATLVSLFFVHLSDAVSLSQSRRAAGFLPFAFAFVGGTAVLTRVLGVFVLPLALVAGVVLEVLWPGDFGFRLEHGGPAAATWIAAFGGVAALVLALVFRRTVDTDRRARLASLACVVFLIPVAVNGFSHWSPNTVSDPNALTHGLVAFLRHDVPKRAVVFSDMQTSYRIAAAAPVLIVTAPPEHVADTKKNDPYKRRREVTEFIRTGDLAIPRHYGSQWLVLARFQRHPTLSLTPVYSDSRYVVYKL
jgi:hypothetical protein